jgi:hypothetical protein
MQRFVRKVSKIQFAGIKEGLISLRAFQKIFSCGVSYKYNSCLAESLILIDFSPCF